MAFTQSTLGTIFCVIASLTESLSGLCAQGLQDVIPPFQLNCYRYVVQAVLSAGVVWWQKKTFRVQQEHGYHLIATIIASTTYNTCYYTAASRLPLGLLVTLTTLVQLLFALFVRKFVQYHIIHMLKIPGCCVVILGSGLMLQPVLAQEANEGFETQKIVGVILVIIAGVSYILTPLVLQNSAPLEAIVVWSFWLSGGGAVVSSVLAVYTDDLQMALTWSQVLFLCGHCLGAGTTGILLMVGSKSISLVTFAILSNGKIVLNFILQYTVMYSVVKVAANTVEILGVLIAMAGIAYTAGFDIFTEKNLIF